MIKTLTRLTPSLPRRGVAGAQLCTGTGGLPLCCSLLGLILISFLFEEAFYKPFPELDWKVICLHEAPAAVIFKKEKLFVDVFAIFSCQAKKTRL
jgi:hypothetical protein